MHLLGHVARVDVGDESDIDGEAFESPEEMGDRAGLGTREGEVDGVDGVAGEERFELAEPADDGAVEALHAVGALVVADEVTDFEPGPRVAFERAGDALGEAPRADDRDVSAVEPSAAELAEHEPGGERWSPTSMGIAIAKAPSWRRAGPISARPVDCVSGSAAWMRSLPTIQRKRTTHAVAMRDALRIWICSERSDLSRLRCVEAEGLHHRKGEGDGEEKERVFEIGLPVGRVRHALGVEAEDPGGERGGGDHETVGGGEEGDEELVASFEHGRACGTAVSV